jgi:5'(3')-deoxyribonucleotidase
MMENKEDVIHISLKWKSEEDALSEIVREINNRYEVELSEGDIQLNQITFKCKTEPNGVTHIKFTPNVIENLTEVIFNSDKLVYIGVYVLSNRFTSDKYLGK